MSKIYDKNDTREVVISKEYRVTGVKCDICGRIIPAVTFYRTDASKYFRVTTGHNDWGNDSCDSVKHRDICPECVGKFVSDYLGDKNGYDTAYIEVETEWVSATYERV